MTWILAIIATEALTELLLHSTPLGKLRACLSRWPFFKEIFECGWCLSLWVAVIVFGILIIRAEVILIPIVLHRLSNYLHVIYSLVKYARRS